MLTFQKRLKYFMGVQSLTSFCGCINFFPRSAVGNPGGGYCSQRGWCFSNLAIEVWAFFSYSCSTFPSLASASGILASSTWEFSVSQVSTVSRSVSLSGSWTSPILRLGAISSSSSSSSSSSLHFKSSSSKP